MVYNQAERIRKRSKRLISPMFAMQDFALPEVTSKRMYLHMLVMGRASEKKPGVLSTQNKSEKWVESG